VLFHNSTHLDSRRLEGIIRHAARDWPLNGLEVVVRNSRKSDFSGTCFYKTGRIYVNLGTHNRYPYLLRTNIARAKSDKRRWWREVYTLQIQDATQLVLFVFMHELYHWLVKKARRNTRQKEARCDRFATRTLVDGFGLTVRDMEGRLVHRDQWDFQDLDGFVAASRGAKSMALRATEVSPAMSAGRVDWIIQKAAPDSSRKPS
jgi:hypothetical protein